MQIKNDDERFFISDDLKDLVSFESLTQNETLGLFISIDNKEFSVLNYVNSFKRHKVTFISDENTLLTLMSNSYSNINLTLNNKEFLINLNKNNLSKMKIMSTAKNSYKIKLCFKNNKEN
tara:strand:+ start:541 stop:900 length:360 start_codon:yes stop_codon:yes gene_type:complete